MIGFSKFVQVDTFEAGELVIKFPGTDLKIPYSEGAAYVNAKRGVAYVSLDATTMVADKTGEPHGMLGQSLIGIIALVCAIWVIYDVLAVNKKASTGMKVVWIICALLFSIITAIVYYFVEKK